MQITQTPAQPTLSQPDSRATTLNSDYETFLQMLTVQMNNQDPLNPVDSSDYAVQLATFSSVEQQVLTNNLLTSLQAQLTTMTMSQIGSWIGMEALTTSPAFFSGEPIEVVTIPDPLADQADLVVLDESGAEVARTAIDPNDQRLDWEGAGLPDGHYTFRTDSYSNGSLLSQQQAGTYMRVTEARPAQNGVALVLEGGTLVQASEISALRLPD